MENKDENKRPQQKWFGPYDAPKEVLEAAVARMHSQGHHYSRAANLRVAYFEEEKRYEFSLLPDKAGYYIVLEPFAHDQARRENLHSELEAFIHGYKFAMAQTQNGERNSELVYIKDA